MALTTIYIIDSTDGSTSFAIQPRTFDGTNGVQQNTDLTLYGNSTPTWGEKFNENFYRSLENFAVDKQGFNPGTDIFDPVDATIQIPKNQFDLSVTGLGVNNPIEGQLWYNKTDKKLYVYSDTGWKSTGNASTSPPANPIEGDLWFEGSTLTLNVWNGTGWSGLLDAGTAGGLGFVQKSGDQMLGDGTPSIGNTVGTLRFHNTVDDFLILGESQGNDSQAPSIRGTGSLVTSAGFDNWLTYNTDNTTGRFIIAKNDIQAINATKVFTIETDGTITSQTPNYETLVLTDNDIPNKKYVDDLVAGGGTGIFVAITGDTMTGDLNLSSTLPTLLITETDEPVGNQIWSLRSQTGDLIIQALDNISTGSGGGNIFKYTRTANQIDSMEAQQSGITWFNINNTSKTLTLTSSGSMILEHDPVLALEASTKQYVDNSISGVTFPGQLLSIDKINYTSYYDINSSSFVTIPGFNVSVVVSAAPVTFIATVFLHVYLSSNGGHAGYFELTVVGGEYVTPTTIAKVTPEGLTAGNIVIPCGMKNSGTLAQNTTYTFSIQGRNSVFLPLQDVRLNTTDGFITSADPDVNSTIEVLTFS